MSASAVRSSDEIPFLSVFTFVLWTMACSVAVIGVVIPYVRPHLIPKPEMILTAETLQVELTTELVASAVVDLPKNAEMPPASIEPISPPLETPPLTAVAEPSVVAFALPVEGPVRVVAPKEAVFVAPAEVAPTNTVAAVPPPTQQLTYGQGEGRQPAPEYPYRARRDGQEGVVKVRFMVGENGQVLSAEAASPSPWKLLNDSALRVVRERWRFRPGAMRSYEVAIRFQLSR